METAIPYHPGLLLGRSIDMRTMKPGYMTIGDEINPTKLKVNLTTFRFSFVNNLKDVCDVLSLPPEYVLKVKARKIENSMVDASLRSIGKPDSFTILYRTTFLQQKEYLPPHVVPSYSEPSDGLAEGSRRLPTTESLIADATADSELSITDRTVLPPASLSDGRRHHGTHWVKAIEIGKEYVTIMTISSKDNEKLDKLRLKISEGLKAYRGQLDVAKVEALQKIAADIDKKISKKHYEDVHLDIQYCSFIELDKYPTSMAGMLKTVENFMDQCHGWSERCKHGLECEVEACVMRCTLGTDKDEKVSMMDTVKQKLSDMYHGSGTAQSVAYHPPRETYGELRDTDVDGDNGSFVVLDSTDSPYFYYLRVTLQSFQGENEADSAMSLSSVALSQYPETTNTMFENLFKLLVSCEKAERLIQDFLSNERYFLESRVEESNKVLKSIQNVHLFVHETIANLDFVCIPDEVTLENFITSDPLATVHLFIENITSKLPPGSDVDLLMIGKTGHGKSSTGNSILGQNRFVSSADEDSVTSRTGIGWAEIDGRTIKVVDTPGVCDTNLNSDASSIDLAIKSISEAIANCPEGFHALLLIIRFGTRMTVEEKKAIGLLKCVLGDDIVKSHCICVITHGDNFESEMAGTKTTFEKWCRGRSGFLKELFEECNYRCVLFNNKARDPKVKKTQLIQLMMKVDSLKDSGTRYTNAIFEFAQRERNRIISEEQVPQVNEEMMRDIQLILEYLNTMVNNTSAETQYKDELSKLRERVDNLRNRVTEAENGQVSTLVNTIFDLAAAIHAKMDEIADRAQPDSPGTSGNETAAKAAGGESAVVSTDLDIYRGELQRYYDEEISPQQSMVTERVTEQVRSEVKNGKECFPGSSVVTLICGKTITLEELQVGDKILVRNDSGELSFDTVYMFGHQEFETNNKFIVMKTASHTVAVTAGHYVFCTKHDMELSVAAEDINIGDCLLVTTGQGLVLEAVSEISYERKKGLFAPFTNSGTIVVDGALMSCYIDVLPHKTCHALLWPMRQLYRFSPHALAYISGSRLQHPVPRWAEAALKLM